MNRSKYLCKLSIVFAMLGMLVGNGEEIPIVKDSKLIDFNTDDLEEGDDPGSYIYKLGQGWQFGGIFMAEPPTFLNKVNDFSIVGEFRLVGNTAKVKGLLFSVVLFDGRTSDKLYMSQLVSESGQIVEINQENTEWSNFVLPFSWERHSDAPDFLTMGFTIERPLLDELGPGDNPPFIEFRDMKLIYPKVLHKNPNQVNSKNEGVLLDAGGNDQIEFNTNVIGVSEFSGIGFTARHDKQNKFPVLKYHRLEMTNSHYMIKGEVKVSGWEPGSTGYLEMWSHLPANKGGSEIAASFFSRTKSPAGSMKILGCKSSFSGHTTIHLSTQ